MKIHKEQRIETTDIVEITFNMGDVKAALMDHFGLNNSELLSCMSVEVAVREYDGEVKGPSVLLYGYKTSKDGEY